MFKVTIIGDKETTVSVQDGTKLSQVLESNGFLISKPCAGRGSCGKCKVSVNGKEGLSCQYEIHSDISVILPGNTEIESFAGLETTGDNSDKKFIALDIGTTTLAMALCSYNDGKASSVVSDVNPQITYGADVISRIEYCSKNGPAELKNVLLNKINEMGKKISQGEKVDEMYVAGNTVMLHTFFGEDCSAMGVSPYTPVFLESKEAGASKVGIDFAEKVVSLPCFASFVGADIFAGVVSLGKPTENKYTLLLDLGTNSEIALFGNGKILCTSSAAGPCFEGAGITCGMTASKGAIYSYRKDGTYEVVGGKIPCGICATGLIDVISFLLETGALDETGNLSEDEKYITEDVYVTREDIRNFQLAKSAVYSGIKIILDVAGISYKDIDRFCVAGGFSDKLCYQSAVNVGLLPRELEDKFIPVNNSSLSGTIKYAVSNENYKEISGKAEYISLSENKEFSDEFIKNMNFRS